VISHFLVLKKAQQEGGCEAEDRLVFLKGHENMHCSITGKYWYHFSSTDNVYLFKLRISLFSACHRSLFYFQIS
jgi:hypothetical protein